MRKWLLGVLAVALLGSCKGTRHMVKGQDADGVLAVSCCLAARMQLSLTDEEGKPVTVGGQLKLLRGERVRLSFIMPVLRTEMVRVEITPADMLVVDRKHREYVRATPQDLKQLSAEAISFASLEQTLLNAATSGEAFLTGRELGLPSLEKVTIRLYDFSTREFTLPSTSLSDKYRPIPWEDLMQMITTQL